MSLAVIAADRTVLELKMYFREKEAVIFSFLFPVIMLSLFSTVFGDSLSSLEEFFDRSLGQAPGA